MRIERTMPSLLLASEAVALLAIAGAAAWVALRAGPLPERIPMHFDLAGHPDRWAAGTWGNALLGPMVGGVAAVMLLGAGRLVDWMAGRHPALVNLPEKERWLRLTAHGRRWAIEPCAVGLALSAVPLALLFAQIAVQSLEVARGERATLAPWPVFACVGAVFVLTIGGIVLSVRRIRRASRLGS